MNILVCISNVPDTTSKINFTDSDSKFDKNGVQFIINPNDEFGLTKAVWMKDSNNASVTVLTVGDSSAEAILRKCLAIGADKAIRIDCEAKDAYSVAKEIVSHCESVKYDLIICGRESIDYNGGLVPGLLAGYLNYNFITNCNYNNVIGWYKVETSSSTTPPTTKVENIDKDNKTKKIAEKIVKKSKNSNEKLIIIYRD